MSERQPDTTTPVWNPELEAALAMRALAFGGLDGATEEQVTQELMRAAAEHPRAIMALLGVLAMRTRRLEAEHAMLCHLYFYTEPDDRAGLATSFCYATDDGRAYRLADVLGLNPDGTLSAGGEDFAAVRLDA